MIYEHALVQPKAIEITAKGPGEPALLQLNKEIREQAREMYYTSNKFSFFVRNAKGAAFTPFVKQASEFLNLETKPFDFRMAGKASFKNLVGAGTTLDTCASHADVSADQVGESSPAPRRHHASLRGSGNDVRSGHGRGAEDGAAAEPPAVEGAEASLAGLLRWSEGHGFGVGEGV